MRIVLFVHSLVSDWNHGNAHFLRGVARELRARGHDVAVYEPADAWSRHMLLTDHGERPLRAFEEAFPELSSGGQYASEADVEALVDDADAAIVHEWNEPGVVSAVGRTRVLALFHDTHHRSVTAPHEIERFDLSGYAGVLAFGHAIADAYQTHAWHDRVWVWHEGADTRLFRPLERERRGDVVWIGNWGDDERSSELRRFLLEPVARLGLSGTIYGVRYPADAQADIRYAGLRYAGWLANHLVPDVFAEHRVTVHVPRRPYVEALPGIPTIRPFEALACGIPLVCSPWDDSEGLFRPGEDYLVARDGREMERHLWDVLHDEELAAALAESGRRTILARHTCAHRVDELLTILGELGLRDRPAVPT